MNTSQYVLNGRGRNWRLGNLLDEMNSSASPSDVVIVVTFCRQLYNNCVEAGGAYDEVSREVRGMFAVSHHDIYAKSGLTTLSRALHGSQAS
jgi:hypothetical protein